MKTSYKHISEGERKIIEELTQAGSSNKTIAKVLKRSTSTIGRELKRNCSYSAWWYKCERAQALSEERRKRSRKPRIREKTWKKVFELFNLDYSPEQIASVVKISHESIYRRIYAEICVMSRKNKGTFWKKFPLNPQKLFVILQRCCKMSKSFKRVWEIFCKRSFKINISLAQFLSERNLIIGRAIRSSWFAAKAISSRWLNEKRDFYWRPRCQTRNLKPSETRFYRHFVTFHRP